MSNNYITVKIGKGSYRTRKVNGVQRFPVNRPVRDLLEAASTGGKLDLNQLWCRQQEGLYTKDEMRELYRIIGYSVEGYSEIFSGDRIDNPLWSKD